MRLSSGSPPNTTSWTGSPVWSVRRSWENADGVWLSTVTRRASSRSRKSSGSRVTA